MMKNTIKTSWKSYFKICLLLTLLVTSASLSATAADPACDCPAPTASMTGHTDSSASFSWNAVSEATAYELWYVRKEDNLSSTAIRTSNTAITLSGFAPGTYTLYIRTICGGSTSAGYIVVDDLVML